METTAASSANATLRTQADTLVKQNAGEDFDKFLRLMTEQLRNQDPLNPADPTEFVAQLATFSSVEQSIKSNEKLDQLIAATVGLANYSATNLIGKAVESQTGQVRATGQPLEFAYEPVADATRAVAQVRDANGGLIRDIPLTLGSERQTAIWDGKSKDGSAVTSGVHAIEILHYKDEDLIAQAPATTQSTVTEIVLDPAGALLTLANGSVVRADEVRAVRAGEAGG